MIRRFKKVLAMVAVVGLLIVQGKLPGFAAAAKLDCGPVTNKSDNLPRTIAIGTNPAGTGAHALGIGTGGGGEQDDSGIGQGSTLQWPQRLDDLAG